MKQILLILLFLCCIISPVSAIEAGDISLDKPNYLLQEHLKVGNTQFWGAYNHSWGMTFDDEHITNQYDINSLNVGADTTLTDKLNSRIMLNYNPYSTRPVMQQLFADVYIQDHHIPHHTITIGNQRPQVTFDGGSSPYTLKYISRSRIGSQFGVVRKLGANVNGDYEHIMYNVGLYSSGTYFKEWFPGPEFVGQFEIRNKTKYGNFKLGTTLDAGKRDDSFFVSSVYGQYKKDRVTLTAEYATANNYNGPSGRVTKRNVDGYYISAGYMITKKTEVLLGMDQFGKSKSYATGLNYYIKGQGLKLMMNYIFTPDNNSHKLLFGTQFLL